MKYRPNRVSHSHRVELYLVFDNEIEPDVAATWVRVKLLNRGNLMEAAKIKRVRVANPMGGVEKSGRSDSI